MFNRIICWLPVGWALRHTFRNGYYLQDFKADLLAAFVVSLIALPLSMALAIAVGLPPQHGIYTAIVAGIVASAWGGSLFQISGPTAAFVVVLLPIVSEFGLRGLIWCQIIAGFLLILFGIIKLGKLIHYIPHTVIIGFTSAIALVLATISFKDFLGLSIEYADHQYINKMLSLIQALPDMHFPEVSIGIVTLSLVVGFKGKIKWMPSPIIGIIGGTLLSFFYIQLGYPIMTIGTEFQYHINGIMHQGIPPYPPTLQFPTFASEKLLTIPSWNEFKILFIPALMIASLAALESLLSATIADKLTQTKHHPNAELKGIGMANIFTGMASGIPATAAIARTATNIQNGARSPIAGIFHALFILLYILIFSSYISAIPMSALAALLIFTAYYMSHVQEFKQILSKGSVFDCVVLFATFILTVFINMIFGIMIGLLLSLLKYLKTNKSIIKSEMIK